MNVLMKKSLPQPQVNQPEGSQQLHPTHTFEDWQADQQADARTPEERGIHIGSPVMWRHRANRIITTERAIVLAIEANTLTLQVKDVESRTCTADISEIVINTAEHSSSADAKRRAYYANQIESTSSSDTNSTKDDTPGIGSLTVS
jgi:hypothetical protein